jgi:hypothetical protein
MSVFKAFLKRFLSHQSLSEEHKDLSDIAFDSLLLLSEDVESHGLGEGPALTNGHDVSFEDSESGAGVAMDSVMAFLESVVLLDVMEIISPDYNGSLHLVGDDNSPN